MGRLITVEGLDGAGKTTLVSGLAACPARPRRPPLCCASRAASSCPSACARSSRTRRCASISGPRRSCTPRPGRSFVAEALRPRLDARRVGAAGPLRGLLAGLPGGGTRAGVRRRARPSTRSRRAACAPSRTPLLRLHGRRTVTPGLHGRDEVPDRLEAEPPNAFCTTIARRLRHALAAAEPDRFRAARRRAAARARCSSRRPPRSSRCSAPAPEQQQQRDQQAEPAEHLRVAQAADDHRADEVADVERLGLGRRLRGARRRRAGGRGCGRRRLGWAGGRPRRSVDGRRRLRSASPGRRRPPPRASAGCRAAPSPSIAARFFANWSTSLPETSLITPAAHRRGLAAELDVGVDRPAGLAVRRS